MGISGNKWAKLIIPFTLKIVSHFFFYRNTFKLACMNTHISATHSYTKTRTRIRSNYIFPILRPPAGVMNFTRFPKYLPAFLFELNAYLASSCCAHSLSYQHSITGSLTRESTHISPPLLAPFTLITTLSLKLKCTKITPRTRPFGESVCSCETHKHVWTQQKRLNFFYKR